MYIAVADAAVVLQIKVVPQSPRTSMQIENDVLKVRLHAPPVDGKANQALIEGLASAFRSFGVRKADIAIVQGQTARRKVVQITCGSPDKATLLVQQVSESLEGGQT